VIHTGVGKQKLRREERSTQKQTKDLAAIAKSYSELKSTTVITLPSFDQSVPTLSRDIMSDGIKKFHEFRFVANGTVECRETSRVGFITVQDASE